MKTTLISKENGIAKFTMEFTAEEFEAAIVKAYQNTKDQYTIDGFRKGKAPRKLIEKHYGEGIFFEDAVNDMFSNGYPQALDELAVDVIDRPKADFTELAAGNGFTVTVEVAVYPEIDVKDYKGVEIEKINYEVNEEAIQNELEAIRRRNARMVVADRPAQEGDTVLLDYAGFLGEEQFEGGTAERFPLKLGSGTFIPGFEEQLIGVKTDEERDVNLSFPEDYPAENLKGQAVTFKCKVHEVKTEELPELNDEFVKDISEFDTLDEYKADVKANLEKAYAARAENEMKDKVVKKVYEANEFDIPEVMIRDEIGARLRELDQQLQYQGLSLEKYMDAMQKKLEEIQDEIREDCYKAVKTKMILAAVAEKEQLPVSDEDITKELDLVAAQYGMTTDQVREALGTQNIAMVAKDLGLRKAIDFMYDNAVIQ